MLLETATRHASTNRCGLPGHEQTGLIAGSRLVADSKVPGAAQRRGRRHRGDVVMDPDRCTEYGTDPGGV